MIRIARILFAVISLFLTGPLWAAPHGEPATDMLCEWTEGPLNVDNPAPRLSWKSNVDAQIAYQIQVASSLRLLESDEPDLWDSGRVVSGISLCIPYEGASLHSRQSCYWRVRVWGDAAAPRGWSVPATWRMGLLETSDWEAGWIQASRRAPVEASPALSHWYELAGHTLDKSGELNTAGAESLRELQPAALFKKELDVKKEVVKAHLYSTAAGYFEVFIDGVRVGNRVMNPAQTDFEKRILYDVDAVEHMLARGGHTITAQLGEGFYGQNVAFSPTKLYYGVPKILIQLEIEYEDGTTEKVVTDDTWKTRPSPVLKNNVYAGEVYDARLASSEEANAWDAVEVVAAPTERLESQKLPPARLVRKVEPVCILNPRPDVWVFDFGQNFTGVPTLNLRDMPMAAGTPIYFRYSEWADDDGNIDQSSDGAFATTVHQVDCYLCGGGVSETWTPAFTWHGFRYVEVTGLPSAPDLELLTGHLVRSSVKRRGRFISSDPHLNRIHETALWTYESNLVSLPSDCPIRERCGWTGDAHATVTMSNYGFDMAAFWEKYLRDFRTNPNVSPSIVPGKRTHNTTPDWAVGQVFIAWEQYLHYGDEQVLREHYEGLQRFMEHYHSLASEGIVEVGYGDWCDPVRVPGTPRVGGAGKPQQTSPSITSTALFVHAADLMAQIARLLDDPDSSGRYADWKTQSARAFHKAFFDATRNTYGSQTADAMALSFGIVSPELRDKVAQALRDNVVEEWNGHASVGALGHRWLYPSLSDAGYADTALGTFYAQGHPGFDYLFNVLQGTSLWERKGAFDPGTMKAPERSLSHPFQGGYDAWFYEGLGGIRPDPDAPGYKHFHLDPVFPARLDWVEVDFESAYGTIKSHWRREENAIHWTVDVPLNSTATIKMEGAKQQHRTLGPGRHHFLFAQNQDKSRSRR